MAHQGKNTIRDRIEEKLAASFSPSFLQVIDESHEHAGHAGHADSSGESHFRVRLVSAAFVGKSRIDRHRDVNRVLAAEFAAGVHALALDAKAPGENGA